MLQCHERSLSPSGMMTGSKFTLISLAIPTLPHCCHSSVPIPALLSKHHPPNSVPHCRSLTSKGRICLFGRLFPSFHTGFFGSLYGTSGQMSENQEKRDTEDTDPAPAQIYQEGDVILFKELEFDGCRNKLCNPTCFNRAALTFPPCSQAPACCWAPASQSPQGLWIYRIHSLRLTLSS